jgi:MYXO-CTERM domain-containing protein
MSGTDLRRIAAVCLLLSPFLPSGAPAATIKVGSATVATAHTDHARICVSLETRANEQVAGTENLLRWDGECATMIDGGCKATPGHGKNLSGSLQRQRDFTYKALVLSFSDTNPIPAGELYCCEFLVHANPGDCCRVSIGSPGGSDPSGNSVSVGAGPPGELCVASDGRGVGSGRSPGNFAGGISGGGTQAAGGGAPSVGAGAPLGGGGAPAAGAAAPLAGGGAPAAGFAGPDTRPEVAPPAEVGDDRLPAPAAEPAAVVPPQAGQRAPVAVPEAAPPPAGGAPAAVGQPTPASAVAEEPPPPDDSSPGAGAAAVGGEEDAEEEDTGAFADEPADDAEPKRDAGPSGDQAKPSPRDVQRDARAGGSDRPRQFPLDDDGCQATRAPTSTSALLLLPLVVLLLGRRRRHI